MLEFRAGPTKSVRTENQMQRWFLGLDGFDDDAGRQDRIARLLPGDFTEMMNGLSARLPISGDRAGGIMDRVLGEKVGAEGAGLNQRDPNAQRPDFLGQAFGQPLQGEFRRRVNPRARHGGKSGDGRHVDDMSPALGPKEGKRRLDHLKWSEKIDVENAPNFRGAGFLDRSKQSIPGIVEDHVQPAVARLSRHDRRPGLVGQRQFQRKDVQPVRERLQTGVAVAGCADNDISLCKDRLG